MAERKTPAAAWLVVLAGLGINLALGVLYTWSIMTQTFTTKLKLVNGEPVAAGAGKYISIAADKSEKAIAVAAPVIAQKAYNWTPDAALLPYAVALLAFAFMMVFAGRAQDKYGPRLIATVGGVLVGLGMIVASFNPMAATANHTAIIVGFGALVGSGIGLAYACATPAAVKWFHPSRKGIITGSVVAGFGLASVYTAPLTKALITSGGPQGAFRIAGIAFFIAIIGLAQLLKNPPQGYECAVPAKFQAAEKAAAAAGKPAVMAKTDYTWQEMVRKPQFFLLWIMYAFAAFAGLMMVGLIAKVAPEQLGDPAFAATWGYTLVVALAIGNGVGRPIAGMLSDAIGRTRTMIIVFLLQALFVGVLLSQAHTLTALLLVAAGIGAMYGANLTLFPATTFDFFGTKNGGVNYGLVFTAWGVGGAVGSYAAGWIKAAYGTFTPAYTIAAGLCVAAAVLSLVVKAPKAAPAESRTMDQMDTAGA